MNAPFDFTALKGRQQMAWASGDYAVIGTTLQIVGESLAEACDLRWDEDVLDVAAGNGNATLAAARRGARVTSTDYGSTLLERGAERARAEGLQVKFQVADAEALPFPDASFELVTCRIAPHHFPDVPTFVAEARRVLVPGGTLAVVDNISPDQVSTPGFSSADLRDASLTYNAFEKIRDPSHGRCLGMAEWGEVIEDAGLEPVHVERLSKAMQFQPWAERMGADATTIERLRAMLDNASPALAAFLKPHLVDGALWFTLDEAILIARKPK